MTVNSKCLFFFTLINGVVCIILLLVVANFGGSSLPGQNDLRLRIPPESWDGYICAKLSGGVTGDGKSSGVKVQEGVRTDVVDEEVVEESIYFHETSCSYDLNPRQACAVESAARANKKKNVYVLMNSPYLNVNQDGESQYARLLEGSYDNVLILPLRLGTYSRGTPMEEWVHTDTVVSSDSIVYLMAEALRYLTLWKYGGTCIDLDVINMKPLTDMWNYGVAEGEEGIGSSIINLNPSGGKGHSLADAFAREFTGDFHSYEWEEDAPGVMTRVLGRLCDVSSGKSANWTGCPADFRVHPQSTFSPVHWSEWEAYFNETTSEDTMKRVESAMAVHLWNKLSSGRAVRVGSRQPYALIAEKYCPVVYSSCGDSF